MDKEDRGYVYLWNCSNEDCGNAEGYWHIYDAEKYHQILENQEDDGDSSSPVSRSEDQNGEDALQDAQSRVSGEPPKTLEELPTAAVRIKYENSPYGWQYSEDPEYGKLLDAEREVLVRRKDVEKLFEEVQQE